MLALIAGSLVPAAFVALILYAWFFTEGWGAFGLAPLLLPISAAGAVVMLLAIPAWLVGFRKGRRDVPLAAVIIANAAVLLLIRSR